MKEILKCLPAVLLLPAALSAPASPPGENLGFGVMTHFAQGWDRSWVSAVAEASIPHIRDELYWDQVEPEKGKYAFPEKYDQYMAELRKKNISPLIVLSFENKNYDHGLTPHTDEAFSAYARYGVEVLRHYGDQIKAVEIWNEYNGTFCKGPAVQDRAGTYLQMLRVAYNAIKRARPDVIVAGGATSGIPGPYWKELLAGGGLAYLDVLSIHPYRYDAPPEGLEDEIAALQNLVKKYNGGRTKPVWVTEIGWGTKESAAPGDLAIDEATQAKFLVRAYALLFSAGVERVYWYLLHDYNGLSMGLLRDDAPHAAKPAYLALATMIRQLRGASFARREATASGFYSLVFVRPTGEEVRVVWSLKPVTLAVPRATAVVNLRGEEVATGGHLQVDDSPLFVTGPLTDLPPPSAVRDVILADSARGFSAQQGANGWFYGMFVGDSTTFVPLAHYSVTDWTQSWTDQYPYLSLTATDQHPSQDGATPVAVVRRWESNFGGTVRISGQFHCGTEGDGVGASILVDGKRRFRKLLGGGANPIVATFDFIQAVRRGTLIDFAVDPGPTVNINYDATSVSVTIKKEAQ